MTALKQIKIARAGYILISILFYISGIGCLIVSDISSEAASIAAGIILIAYGMIKITGYLSKDLYCLAFQYDFACGLFLIVLGIVVLAIRSKFEGHLLSGLGFLILLDSLLGIQTSIDARKFGIVTWYVILLSSILSGVLGVVLIITNAQTAAGGCLLAEGFMRQYIVQCTVYLSPSDVDDRGKTKRKKQTDNDKNLKYNKEMENNECNEYA